MIKFSDILPLLNMDEDAAINPAHYQVEADKADTAGKIEWYARKLKEVENNG